jgi:hypothetical protein
VHRFNSATRVLGWKAGGGLDPIEDEGQALLTRFRDLERMRGEGLLDAPAATSARKAAPVGHVRVERFPAE